MDSSSEMQPIRPTLFLSYARADLPSIEPLLRQLKRHRIKVWRDQEKLYAGQRWAKALGEAIAAHDVILLVWYAQAEKSQFVEFE